MRALLAAVIAAASVSTAWATPTGLNNIPTADVVPLHVLVLQSWTNSGSGLDTAWAAGAKYGPAENWEVGLDGGLTGPGSGGGPVFQAKYRVPLEKGGRVLAGVANLSENRDFHGDYFPYVVASVPVGERANGHLGYSFQSATRGLFLGADVTVGRALTLRSDWIHTDDGDESVASLGFITPVAQSWAVEGWASFPTAPGAETNYVLKVDYVIPFGK
jgi:hypothetical protein